jgi:predicted 3-demethylubiquinone-9 3-methyltransferase (glyoxalase superfamily)
MNAITPCLWFDTQGEDAANLYVSVFKNSRITGVSRYGEGAPRPAGTVMTVEFELNGQPFVALNGGPEYSFTEAVSFQVGAASQEEVDEYWGRLTEGGEEGQCGWLKDRFGVSWQIVPTALGELLGDPDPVRSQAAMQAMLGMRKLDVAEMRRAADEAAAAT